MGRTIKQLPAPDIIPCYGPPLTHVPLQTTGSSRPNLNHATHDTKATINENTIEPLTTAPSDPPPPTTRAVLLPSIATCTCQFPAKRLAQSQSHHKKGAWQWPEAPPIASALSRAHALSLAPLAHTHTPLKIHFALTLDTQTVTNPRIISIPHIHHVRLEDGA